MGSLRQLFDFEQVNGLVEPARAVYDSHVEHYYIRQGDGVKSKTSFQLSTDGDNDLLW